jgi:shikimate kinase
LLDYRQHYYKSAAEITISTNNKDPSQIASEIIRKLKIEIQDKKK